MKPTTETPPQVPYIINTGGSSMAKPIVIGLLLVGGFFVGKKALKAYQERQGEKNLDTPEGQIALQLKNVFDSTIVSDDDFRSVYLQVNNSNKDEVFKQYRMLSGRNLSDDIAKHISKGTLTHSVKTEAINNKVNGVIKIDANENINWLISQGSKVTFTDPKKQVYLYPTTKGLLWNLTANDLRPTFAKVNNVSINDTIKATLIGRKDTMKVMAVMLLPYDGIKLATDWTKYFRPIVNTRKVFAIVRIEILDNKKNKKYFWVDARDLSTKATTLKGIGSVSQLAY